MDLQLLEALVPNDSLALIRRACIAVFATRAAQTWPPKAMAQPHWGPIYARALEGLEELDVANEVDAEVTRVQGLISQIDAAHVKYEQPRMSVAFPRVQTGLQTNKRISE